MHAESRRKEKIQMRKQIKAHEERDIKTNNDKEPSEPMPSYLLDRNKWVEILEPREKMLTFGQQPQHSKVSSTLPSVSSSQSAPTSNISLRVRLGER
jgi:hypothetical protein